MIVTKKVTKEVEVEDYIVCDKCDDKIVPDYWNSFDFDFTLRTGKSYPEGGFGEEDSMQLCEDCAEQLVAFLKTEGYRILKKDWDC